MTPLSRTLGAHLGLLSMASSVMFSATPAAFASTATRNVNLSVTVTETFSFTVDSGVVDVTKAFGSLAAGAATATQDATFKVISNAAAGYNVTIANTKGACGTVMCSGTFDMPDKALWDGTASGTALAAGEGLAFRLVKTGTLAALYADARWGANDAAGALYAGIPTTARTLVIKGTQTAQAGDDFIVRFGLAIPAFQETGTYTSTNPVVFTATSAG